MGSHHHLLAHDPHGGSRHINDDAINSRDNFQVRNEVYSSQKLLSVTLSELQISAPQRLNYLVPIPADLLYSESRWHAQRIYMSNEFT
jgi:hypothetical protein